MNGDAKWTVNLNLDRARQQAHQAIFEGVREIFEIDIKGEAVERSPVVTGTNRRSIDTEVEQSLSLDDGSVHAKIFTQSGYGGYLEIGTWKMKAQPYLYPAFNKFIGKLVGVIKKRINTISPGMFKIKKG